MAPKQAKRAVEAEEEEDKEETSGSDALVSDSGEEEEDEEEDEEEEEAEQLPAPDDGEGSDFEELQVDFEFFDLAPIDFHGLRALLARYLDGEQPFALSELVEALIAQANSVGTVIKANGDVDPLGCVSVLPFALHDKQPFLAQILGFLRRKCPKAVAPQLEALCTAPRVGLVISERMINVPPEPLMAGLAEEIGDIGGAWWWESEKEPTEERRKAYEFDRFLVLTRVYRDDAGEAGAAGAAGAAGGEPRAKKARAGAGAASAGGALAGGAAHKLIFPKPEDAALMDRALWSFTFPAAVAEATAVSDRASQLTQLRLVMCVEASALLSPAFVKLVAAKAAASAQ